MPDKSLADLVSRVQDLYSDTVGRGSRAPVPEQLPDLDRGPVDDDRVIVLLQAVGPPLEPSSIELFDWAFDL